MKFSVKRKGTLVIVTIPCSLDSIIKVEKVHEILEHLYEKKERKIILNIENTWHISSKGIGVILSFYKKFNDSGRSLCLANPTAPVREKLTIMRLDEIIPIYPDKNDEMIG